MNVSGFILCVAVGGAHIRRALVGTLVVADVGIDLNVRLGFSSALIAIGHESESL
jgi:hypothetical protein